METMDSDVKSEDDRATMSASREELESHSDETIELGPTRSQNGHGCADISDKDDDGDPFEVSFDGDDDPMCPRSSRLISKASPVDQRVCSSDSCLSEYCSQVVACLRCWSRELLRVSLRYLSHASHSMGVQILNADLTP